MPRLFIGNREITPAVVRNISVINNQDKTITENGKYTADAGYTGLGEVTVSVPSEQPVIQQLSVSPTRTAQTIVAPVGVDGYSPINVAAVTSSIDSNIVAGNIKKDVNILGVTGNYEGGTIPTGTLNIITNGNYDVTDYARADVNIPEGGIGIPRTVSASGAYQIPTQSFTFSLPSDATDMDVNAMQYAFDGCKGLISADLSSLTTVSGNYAMQYAFRGCTGLTSVNLSSLTTVSGNNAMFYAFRGCTGLTSANLSSLATVSGNYAMYYAFDSCTRLTSVNLSSLTVLSGRYALSSAFQSCTSLATLSFPALTSTSFGSYTNQFNTMLMGVTGCAVHFPSNLQSVIGSWSDVTSGFGGTNTTVLFDLPATN